MLQQKMRIPRIGPAILLDNSTRASTLDISDECQRYAVSDDFELEGYSSLNIAWLLYLCVELISFSRHFFLNGTLNFELD